MTTIGLVLDCRDPEVLADFWAHALGYERIGAAGQYFLLLPSQTVALSHSMSVRQILGKPPRPRAKSTIS